MQSFEFLGSAVLTLLESCAAQQGSVADLHGQTGMRNFNNKRLSESLVFCRQVNLYFFESGIQTLK